MVQNSLEQIVEAEGLLNISDTHGHEGIVLGALSYANDNKLGLVVNGDVVNDYNFKEYGNRLGIKSVYDIQLDYFSQNLSEKDLETLSLVQTVEQYGIENILSQIPENQKENFKNNLEETLRYAQSDLFKTQINQVSENLITEKGEEIQENSLKFRALYDVFMDEEARRFANQLNQYSDVTVLFNKGNHENVFFVEQVRQYLDNKNQIIDLSNSKGVYTIKSSLGNEINVAGLTNCSQFMPYLEQIIAPEEIQQLYSHMSLDEVQIKSLLQGDVTIEDLDKLKDFYSKDKEFRRIKDNLNGKNIDILYSHGQIGTPMGLSNARDVPYLSSAAALGLESKLIVEGHIHNKFEGKNSFGVDMIRSAGEIASIITKDKEGNLEKSFIRVGENYGGGHNNEIPYEDKYMLLRIEDMIKQYKQAQLPVDNNNSDSSSKVA